MMRIIRAIEATGPLVEVIAAFGIGLALLYVYYANLSAARFIALNFGIALLYEPIKTLSRMSVVMQQSIQATTEVFAIMDMAPTIQDAPNAGELRHCEGLIEFDHTTFRYAGGVTDAVTDLDLRIEPGKTAASRWRRSPANVSRSSAQAARARAPFSPSSCGSTIQRQAASASMVRICGRSSNNRSANKSVS